MRIAPSGHVDFPASDSPDVTGYKMYYREVGANTPGGDPDDGGLEYADTVIDVPVPADGSTTVSVDLSTLNISNVDGALRVGLSAIDDVGNESDIGPTVDVPFDQAAPNPPGAGVYVPPSP